MIVPRFWAEGRVQHREKRKQITIRRYGWSDASQEEAQAHANARAADAMARVRAGEKLHRRDHKIPYNGAEGLPIREEILSTHGEVVITRNSYGAHCLNTPNVLFADVDIRAPRWFSFIAFALAIYLASRIYPWVLEMSVRCCERPNRTFIAILTFLVLWAAFSMVAVSIRERMGKPSPGREKAIHKRIRKFASDHPQWSLRVYRTPAGFRVLATHAVFTASQPEVAQIFSALRVDPLYERMCLNQQCFRARLTAKPWRIGIPGHMRPHPGIWPIKPEQRPARADWVGRYEPAAAGYAACRYVETLGSGVVDPAVRAVMDLHDSQSRAMSELPLA